MPSFDIQPYLDHRNQALWNEISSHFHLDFQYGADGYKVFTSSTNEATIYLPYGPPCKESLTHELLHLLLAKRGIHITGSLAIQLCEPIFDGIFQPGLAEHIGNCLNHVKMLPKYLSMGFDRQKFIQDYDQPKLCNEELAAIQGLYAIPGTSWGAIADLYVGRYFAMKACPNPVFDYSHKLSTLNQIDQELFAILEICWQEWELYDVDVEDSFPNSYRTTSSVLVDGLKDWAIKKRAKGFA